MTDTLVEALDDGARKLLDMAMAPSIDADGKPTLTTLSERVKAFEAAVEWAKTRQELVVPEKAPTKFEMMRSEFNGDGSGKTTKRRRNSTAATKTDGAGHPEPGADSASGGSLFEV